LLQAYRDLAYPWHPKRIGIDTSVIFIAESPPPIREHVKEEFLTTGSVDSIPYFYNPKECQDWRRLAYAMSTLFYEPDTFDWIRGDRKRRFLRQFQRSGFLLMDFSEVPLAERKSETEKQSKGRMTKILTRVNDEPHSDVVVLLKGLEDLIPNEIKGDGEHFRIVRFPTRFGIGPVRTALEELGYVFDEANEIYLSLSQNTGEGE
jgi:hypothetical protein